MGKRNAHTPGGDDDGFPIFNHGGGPLRHQEGGMRVRAPLVATRYGVAMRKNSPTVDAPDHALPFQCPESLRMVTSDTVNRLAAWRTVSDP
jgi:hypothetical protein